MITPNKELEQRRIEARALYAENSSQRNQANIDYIAMMTDVDIPTEEPAQEVVDNE